jgi:uncharacterized protein (DUF983 family)
VVSSPRPIVMFLRGTFGRCPRCGGGGVIRKLDIVDRCPRCGMKFEREEGFFLGAFTINFGVVLISLAAFIGISVAITLPDPPRVPLVVAGMLLCAVVGIGYYPFSKTVWSAFYLMLQPLSDEERQSADEAREGGRRSVAN